MEYVKKTVLEIINHIEEVIDKVDEKELKRIVTYLINSRRVFVYGLGRSGYVGKSFAARLSHLKFEVFVVGETITPAVMDGDVFFAISGSGETDSMIHSARVAKKENVRVIAITSNKNSTLAKLADSVLHVKGRTKNDIKRADYVADQIAGKHAPLSPLGTLFEDACMVILDGLIVELMQILRKTEADMARRHANIE